MRIQSVAATSDLANFLRKTLTLTLLLAFSTVFDAHSAPLFCSDLTSTSTPDHVLTGCQTDTRPMWLSATSPDDDAERYRDLDAIDAILFSKPQKPQLFQIGRHALAEDREDNIENAPPGGTTQVGHATVDGEQVSLFNLNTESLSQDERWYYMNIDQDGTYLFFGDGEMPEADEPGGNPADEELVPDGIGIGKKWYF